MNIRNKNCRIKQPLNPNSLDPIIDNGSLVQMGINEQGHLNVPGGTPSFESGTTVVGLRYIPTNGEATAPGCLCEGWGVANADDSTGSFAAYANVSVDGVVNLTLQPGTGVTDPTGQILPESVGSAFKSIVRDTTDNRVEVTHDYKPSLVSENLYKVDVTIENIGSQAIGDLRYRRVMDWDIPPTTFNEWVEIHVGGATNILRATTDGFDSANPLSISPPGVGTPPTTVLPNDPDYFSGPTDQGALFDFGFGVLNPGESITFSTFYGAAANRDEALTAIILEKAEVYSFSFANDSSTEEDRPAVNGPNVFIFAFSGVGGTPVDSADLAVSKIDDKDPVKVGQILTYVIKITNNGPTEATNVTLVDSLPNSVDFILSNSSQGSCSENGGEVTCDIGTLANGATAIVEIMVRPKKIGTITNTATVTSDKPDPDPTNNIAKESTRVKRSKK